MFNKVSSAVGRATNQAGLLRKLWSQLEGLVNFINSALGLPAFWTQVTLSGDARMSLLKKALPRGQINFQKLSPLGYREVWTDASLQGMATLERDRVRLIQCPDSAFSINDREYLAALLGLSRVPCRLFGDNPSSS